MMGCLWLALGKAEAEAADDVLSNCFYLMPATSSVSMVLMFCLQLCGRDEYLDVHKVRKVEHRQCTHRKVKLVQEHCSPDGLGISLCWTPAYG